MIPTTPAPNPLAAEPTSYQIAALLVRHAMTIVAGFVGAHGVSQASADHWTQAATPLAISIVLAGGMGFWSWAQKRWSAQEKAAVVAIAAQLYQDSPEQVVPAPALLAQVPPETAAAIVAEPVVVLSSPVKQQTLQNPEG